MNDKRVLVLFYDKKDEVQTLNIEGVETTLRQQIHQGFKNTGVKYCIRTASPMHDADFVLDYFNEHKYDGIILVAGLSCSFDLPRRTMKRLRDNEKIRINPVEWQNATIKQEGKPDVKITIDDVLESRYHQKMPVPIIGVPTYDNVTDGEAAISSMLMSSRPSDAACVPIQKAYQASRLMARLLTTPWREVKVITPDTLVLETDKETGRPTKRSPGYQLGNDICTLLDDEFKAWDDDKIPFNCESIDDYTRHLIRDSITPQPANEQTLHICVYEDLQQLEQLSRLTPLIIGVYLKPPKTPIDLLAFSKIMSGLGNVIHSRPGVGENAAMLAAHALYASPRRTQPTQTNPNPGLKALRFEDQMRNKSLPVVLEHLAIKEARGKAAVLYAGGQLYAAICRVYDELGVEPVLLPLDTPPEKLKHFQSITISGGGASVYEKGAPTLHPDTVKLLEENPNIAVLGICYGLQLLAHLFGGKVSPLELKEYGKINIQKTGKSRLLDKTPDKQRVLMSHGDSIQKLPDGFEAVANSDSGLVAAIQDTGRNLYGVQFHPEATAISTHGKQILANFLFRIAGYEPKEPKTLETLIESQKEKVRKSVKEIDILGIKHKQRVFFGMSGGVDSSVAAHIAEEVLGPNRCEGFIIDTGGMRKGEVNWVYDQLTQVLKMKMHKIAAEEYFLNTAPVIQEKQGGKTVEVQMRKLSEETDPAKKRLIFSALYNQLFRKVVAEHGFNPDLDVFGQGTLRPDIIESRSRKLIQSIGGKQIKKHHNVDLDFPYNVEPNEDLHKDQIRMIAAQRGLPPQLAFRQPFPGPGLYCRTVCADGPIIDEKYQKTAEELSKFSKKEGIESFLMPIKTVGIKGDDRSVDFAAVLAGAPDWEKLMGIADHIPRIIHGVNRVYYIFDKSVKDLDPTKIITPTRLNKEVLDQLREADAIVNELQEQAGIDSRQIAQFPVSMLPANFGAEGLRTITLRPFITEDFYTGLAALPTKKAPGKEEISEELVFKMKEKIQTVPGIAAVLYDLQGKPCGTIEVE